MSTRNHDVFILAQVMVKVCNIRDANQAEAVKQAFKATYPEELNRLLTKEYAAWESRCHGTQLEEKAPLLFMVDEDPDESGQIPCTTWWQMDPAHPGKVEPVASAAAVDQRMQDAFKFIETFLSYYEKAELFSWDEAVIAKLVKIAKDILNRNVLIGASDDKDKHCKSA